MVRVLSVFGNGKKSLTLQSASQLKRPMPKYIELPGTRMAYVDEPGTQPPVIVMHGWGCNSSTVASIAAMAAAASHRVISVDFPGFGASPEPPSTWGVEEYSQAIEKLVSEEKLVSPILIGHSFGGRVAVVVASRNQVGKVVLVDAAGVKPRRSLSYYARVYSFKLSKLLYKAFLGSEKASARIEEARAKKGSSDYAQATQRMRAILSKVVNEDLCELMPQIQAPTLLIWGENDKATPLRDAKKMEKLISGAGLVTFPGCGHYSFLDNPRGFAAVLTSFLKS